MVHEWVTTSRANISSELTEIPPQGQWYIVIPSCQEIKGRFMALCSRRGISFPKDEEHPSNLLEFEFSYFTLTVIWSYLNKPSHLQAIDFFLGTKIETGPIHGLHWLRFTICSPTFTWHMLRSISEFLAMPNLYVTYHIKLNSCTHGDGLLWVERRLSRFFLSIWI